MKIILRDLSLSCLIGIDAAERCVRQQILFDADIKLAVLPESDETPSLDYHALVAKLRQFAATSESRLLETFAADAAEILLADAAVAAVRIYCRKPKALADLGEAGVEIEKRAPAQRFI